MVFLNARRRSLTLGFLNVPLENCSFSLLTMKGVLGDESSLTNVNLCECLSEVRYRVESHLANK